MAGNVLRVTIYSCMCFNFCRFNFQCFLDETLPLPRFHFPALFVFNTQYLEVEPGNKVNFM